MKKEDLKISTFKVGDKVTIVKPALSSSGYSKSGVYWNDNMDKYIGNEYTIKELRDNSLIVTGIEDYVFPYEAIKPEPKFKVGDKVRIKKPSKEEKSNFDYGWNCCMDTMVGGVYPIESINDSYDSFRVNGWLFELDSLEKVEVDTLQVSMEDEIAKFVEYLNERHEKEQEAKKKNKIKRGDIVCVIKQSVILDMDILKEADLEYHELCEPTIGQLAEVTDKFKFYGDKYLVLSYHDETYIVLKSNVIKTLPQPNIV